MDCARVAQWRHWLAVAKHERSLAQSPAGTGMRGGQSDRSWETMGGNAVCVVDARGVPPSLVGSGANAQDVKLLAPTLDRTVISRPEPAAEAKENLCADAGCKGEPALQEVLARNYVPQVKQRREEAAEKLRHPGFKARPRVVERTHSRFDRFRKLLVSFEKTGKSFEALLALPSAMIC